MRHRLVLIALIVATLLASGPVRRAGFVYEDPVYLSFAQRALTLQDVVQPRGLTSLSFRLNGLMGGAQPQGYHAVNVGLHLLVGLAFFGLARTLLPVPYALFGAGMVLLHPINSEAVDYVAGRAELLAALGTLLAVWALSGAVTWTAAGLAFLATVFAVGGKEMGVMAIPLIGLHAIVIRRVRWLSWRTIGWAALGLVALALLAIPIFEIRVLGALEYIQMSERNPVRYALTQVFGIVMWLSNVLWPSRLTVDYDYDFVTQGQTLACLALLLSGGVVTWWYRRRMPVVTFGYWWILIAVIPRLIVPISEQINLHQVYVPFLGVWLMGSAGLQHLNAYITRVPQEDSCADTVSSVS